MTFQINTVTSNTVHGVPFPAATNGSDHPQNFEEWKLALSNPNSYQHKELVKCIMDRIIEKNIIQEFISAFITVLDKKEKQCNSMASKKINAAMPFTTEYKTTRHMGLFS